MYNFHTTHKRIILKPMKLTESQLRKIILEELAEAEVDEGILDSLKGIFGGKSPSLPHTTTEPKKTVGHKGMLEKFQKALDNFKKSEKDFDNMKKEFVKSLDTQLRNLKSHVEGLIDALDASRQMYGEDPVVKQLLGQLFRLQLEFEDAMKGEGSVDAIFALMGELKDVEDMLQDAKASLKEGALRHRR